MAAALPSPHESVLIINHNGKEKRRAVRYNAVAVKPPGYYHKLHFVVVKGFGYKADDASNEAGQELYQHTEYRCAGARRIVLRGSVPWSEHKA